LSARRLLRLLALPAVLLPVLLAGAGRAAAPPAAPALGFAGITAAALAASPLSADSVPCGLALDRLGQAARQTLADGGLTLDAAAPVRVALSAVTIRVPDDQGRMPAGGACATTVLLGVYAEESFFSASAGWLSHGYVVIWQRTLMVATPAERHPAAVAGAIDRLAGQMLAAWHAANRPPPAGAVAGQAGEPPAGQAAAGGADRLAAGGGMP
jgi:hypothetical protein